MKSLLSSNLRVAVAVVVVIAVGGAIWYVIANEEPTLGSYTVANGTVAEALDEPGAVAAEQNHATDLSFQESGKIAQVFVTEGEMVSAGEALAVLNQQTLLASLEEASSAVAAAQAQLSELEAGTRPQELAVDESTVASAQAALATDIENAYAAADDAVHNQTDNLFSSPDTNSPTFLVAPAGSQVAITLQTERVDIGNLLDSWNAAIASSSDLSSLAATAIADTQQIQSYLNDVAGAVNSAIPSNTVSIAQLATYKEYVETARSEVSGAASTLTAAQSTLATAQSELVLAQAGSTAQAIQSQEAVVAQAQAAEDAAQVALDEATLTAPFPGTVQNLTAQVGQVVAPGEAILSVVNNGGLSIQTYVSELDVAKVHAGDTAQVTLDAFGTGAVFPATVTTIDSDETMVEGVPSYLVTLYFSNPEPEVKVGMTGNVHLIIAQHSDVVAAPSRLVLSNGNESFVLVKSSDGIEERPVEVGLTGGGMTEVTAGLAAGDAIANF